MNCPNCNQRPMGKLQLFRLNGVTVKQKLEGYLRCRHCGTLLKQKSSRAFIPKYHKKYWIYGSLFFASFLSLTLYLLRLFPNSNIGFWIIFIGAVITLLFVIGEVQARYSILEEVGMDTGAESVKKISKTGLVLFTVLLLVATLMPLAGSSYIKQLNPGLFTFVIGMGIYVVAVFYVAIFIVDKFSKIEMVSKENN